MVKNEVIPGFQLEQVRTRGKKLGHTRIIKTGRRNLFRILDTAHKTPESDGKTLLKAIDKHGALATYSASRWETLHGTWTVPVNHGEKRDTESMTRYAREADVIAAVRQSADKLLLLEKELEFPDRRMYEDFTERRKKLFSGLEDGYDFDMYLAWLADGLVKDSNTKLADCIAMLDSNTARIYEQQWQRGDLVISNENSVMHRRHHEGNKPLTSNCMWHTDSRGNTWHALFYPYDADDGQVVRKEGKLG